MLLRSVVLVSKIFLLVADVIKHGTVTILLLLLLFLVFFLSLKSLFLQVVSVSVLGALWDDPRRCDDLWLDLGFHINLFGLVIEHILRSLRCLSRGRLFSKHNWLLLRLLNHKRLRLLNLRQLGDRRECTLGFRSGRQLASRGVLAELGRHG